LPSVKLAQRGHDQTPRSETEEIRSKSQSSHGRRDVKVLDQAGNPSSVAGTVQHDNPVGVGQHADGPAAVPDGPVPGVLGVAGLEGDFVVRGPGSGATYAGGGSDVGQNILDGFSVFFFVVVVVAVSVVRGDGAFEIFIGV